MPVNDLTFNQLSTLLNAIQKQATGETGIVATNTNEFVAVGQKVLKTGYDTTLNAISQVLTKTIFSTRPYTAKFKGLQVSQQRFGNITRKLSIADKDFVDDDRQKLIESEAIDQYIVNKPNVLELNYYGANVYQKSITIFKDQLDQAFNSPEEFGSFVSMVMSNISDQMEQARENLARATVANYVAGKVEQGGTYDVINLLTEYNTLTGLTLTKADIYKPENYKDFMQWVNSRINELAGLMSERSQLFHTNVTGKAVTRHTPMTKLKMYLHAPYKYGVESRVLADTFHDNYLKFADNEVVNFWQSIETPDTINAKSVYLVADGTLEESATAVTTTDVFGVMFDEETMGYTLVNQWSAPSPFNARGGYTNIFWHETARYWTDYTENGIVLLLK
jgi:hypothetical protein